MNPPPRHASTAEPEYACALIEDARGRLLLELRPPTARRAGARLTCFGGRREAGEDALACVRRELREELGWTPAATPAFACDLVQGSRWIARFFRLPLDRTLAELSTEPGTVAILAPWCALPGLPLSPWHGAVFAAVAQGRTTAISPDDSA